MADERLYYPPDHTVDVLREVTSGASTIEDLADRLGYAAKTASNKVHDPVVLGLIERDDYQLSVSEDARRVVQLEDSDPLQTAFCELEGVPEILSQIDDEAMGVEKLGRLVSFKTGSSAASESTFKNYGRVYAKWIDYLELGNYSNGFVATGELDKKAEHLGPLENSAGANYPKVPPEKVFEFLPQISKKKSREDLKEAVGYSDSEVSKILSTCYGLGLAKPSRNAFELTDRGKNLQQASVGNRKSMLQEALLDIPLMKAYCDRAPDEKFRNQDIMSQISEDYAKGWSEKTIQTRAKRIYSWLLFTELFEEESRGYLKPRTIDSPSESAAT